jgi:membrane-associated protease RseP (regulator of RpoE activity)
MTYRHRALIALVLAGALTAAGFAAARAASDSRSRSRSSERSDRSDRNAGFLGVNLQDLSDGLADSYDYDGNGVVVSSVVDGSPADKAGIREGDIITRFNGTSVNSADQLTRRVRALAPGTLADITVWRDGKERDLDRVEIGNIADADGNDDQMTPRMRRYDSDDEAPVPPRTPRTPRAPRAPVAPRMRSWNLGPGMRGFDMMQMGRGRLGVETRDLDSDLGEYFDTPDGKGVLVLRVMEDTPAAEAGLKAGDVILSIDGQDVDNSDELRKEIRSKKAGPVELRIRRKGTERTLSATLAEAETGFGDGQNWIGGLNDNDNDNDNDNPGRRVFRLHTPNGDREWIGGDDDDFHMDGLSEEDKAQLKKDLQKLREDLREMRRDKRSDR